jgi:chromosome segregation ATPase
MDDHFELLEHRVQKAAARLRELRAENASLRSEVQAASARAERAERAARAGDAQAPPAASDELTRARSELRQLGAEREEIRARVARLLELLERLD